MDRPPPLFERWDKTPFWSSPIGIMLGSAYWLVLLIAAAYFFLR